MSHNDALDYTRRIYARIPAHYRVYDEERGYPLLSLIRVVGEQVSNLRQDLDALWDNFFIETSDDWVVPYIGALVGTNLLPRPVGQSNRLDVWNTVLWRRSKGTPAMLRALAQAISGWPTDLAEFFQMLGWSQNMNHLRLDHPLTVDVHSPYKLSLLGHAADPFSHAADFKPARPLDQARVALQSLGIGIAGWGTPGRYQIKNLGFFARRLQTFAVHGATPAAAAPGSMPAPNPACFTFDPLFQEIPLFVEQTGESLTRAAFGEAPWQTFGKDLAVRQFGMLLASEVAPTPSQTSKHDPFTFGLTAGNLSLHPAAGMRLLQPGDFQLGGAHFVISALWEEGGTRHTLGRLSTLHAALGDNDVFHSASPPIALGGSGKLVITIQTGRAGLGWAGMPSSPPARFPGATLAVRAARSGALHQNDGLYIALPLVFVAPGTELSYYVAVDGSTYTTPDLSSTTLARAGEGEGIIYPPRAQTNSTAPAAGFIQLNRKANGMHLPDPGRFGGAGVLIQAEIFTGTFQALGAIATMNQAGADYPDLQAPAAWPALTYVPSKRALSSDLPDTGTELVTILLKPLTGNFIPPVELILTNRSGQSLLVYLPEVSGVNADGIRFFVAEDGSTYFAPEEDATLLAVQAQGSYSGLTPARASAGQVLPIQGIWPLQQRSAVAINLCHCERCALLHPGELGIDPELGRFAFAPGDPLIGQGNLSVDYVEAFSDRVGARTFDRQLDPAAIPSRLIVQSGDAGSLLNPNIPTDHIHTSIADALANAQDGDVIEICDSATYIEGNTLTFNKPEVKRLTLRAAAGQRPCIVLVHPGSPPLPVSLRIVSDLDRLELNGLLISGGPLVIESYINDFQLIACTLNPRMARTEGSLIAGDPDLNHRAAYLLCRCITGGLRVGAGVGDLTIADSIVDQQGGLAIGGLVTSSPGGAFPAAQSVQLERVTVLGRIHCDVLHASESLLDDITIVEDRQAGCIRFSRYELGSVLPRRFMCVPSDAETLSCSPQMRCLAPLFNSRRFGRPDYVQLAAACPPEILTASEAGAEVGAFASLLNTIRLENLDTKLREFLPAGLTALVIAET